MHPEFQLTEMLQNVASAKTVAAQIQKKLPNSIIAKPRSNGIAEIYITHKDGAFEGNSFFEAFGLKSTLAAYDEDDEDGNDARMWEQQDKCYAKFSQIVQHILDIIPHGWIIANSICTFERDDLCPYVLIRLALDYNRKSRSKADTWYHITLASNLNSIKQNGLVPSSNVRGQMEGYKNRLFLMSAATVRKKSHELAPFAKNLQSTPPVAFGDDFIPPAQFSDIALLKITLPQEMTKRLDPHAMALGGVYVNQTISPQYIEVVYQGPIDQLINK